MRGCVLCRDLDRPVDWESVRRLGKRAVLVCAPDDIWFPMHHYFQTEAAVPGIEVRTPGWVWFALAPGWFFSASAVDTQLRPTSTSPLLEC